MSRKERLYEQINDYIKTDSIHDNYRNEFIANGYTGWIYFLEEQLSKCVKIGYTQDIKARIDALKVGCPNDLRLLWAIKPKNRNVERKLHKHLEGSRKSGEWFNPTEEVYETINYLIRLCFDGCNYGYIEQLIGD